MPLSFRYAWRSAWTHKPHTVAAVATVAVGIGAVTALFTAVYGVLLKPLPGYEPDRVVAITQESPRRALNLPAQTDLKRWQEQTRSFSNIAGQQNCPYVMERTEQVMVPCVTPEYFRAMGVAPALGRTFTDAERLAIVLDHDFWQQRFGGSSNVLGKQLSLDGKPYQIVGVLPRDFHPWGRGQTRFYVPFDFEHNPASLNIVARLAPGSTLAGARAELAVLDQREPDIRTLVTPLLAHTVGPDQTSLVWMLFAAAGFVMLLATMNAAGLALARRVSRRQEEAIRMALGASRWSLLRMSLAENLLLSLAGSLAGIAIAGMFTTWIARSLTSLPRVDELQLLEAGPLGFAIAAALASAVLASILPVHRWSLHWLSIAQTAAAFLLVCGAGLLLASLRAIGQTEIGYEPDGVWTAFASLPEQQRAGAETWARLRQRAMELPGVASAATATSLPTGGVTINMLVYREGEDPEVPKPNETGALLNYVSGGYFESAGVRIVRGRQFAANEKAGVAMVSENLARRYFGSAESAIGKRILIPEVKFALDGIGKWLPREIVGVTRNIRRTSIADTTSMDMYLPEWQNPLRMTYLLVRFHPGAAMPSELVRRAVSSELPVSNDRYLSESNGYLRERQSKGAKLLSVMAALALALAAAGVFGVAAHAVSQRSHELGIRAALGATPASLRRLVLSDAIRRTTVGLVIGTVAGLGLFRLMNSLLYGVSPNQPGAFVASGVVLLGAVLLAAWIPAAWAAKADPARAIRSNLHQVRW